jgi:hypothetical protein
VICIIYARPIPTIANATYVDVGSSNPGVAVAIALQYNANRVWMSSDAVLYDSVSGFSIKGPQFMLIQPLFFLSVKISVPNLVMEYA